MDKTNLKKFSPPSFLRHSLPLAKMKQYMEPRPLHSREGILKAIKDRLNPLYAAHCLSKAEFAFITKNTLNVILSQHTFGSNAWTESFIESAVQLQLNTLGILWPPPPTLGHRNHTLTKATTSHLVIGNTTEGPHKDPLPNEVVHAVTRCSSFGSSGTTSNSLQHTIHPNALQGVKSSPRHPNPENHLTTSPTLMQHGRGSLLPGHSIGPTVDVVQQDNIAGHVAAPSAASGSGGCFAILQCVSQKGAVDDHSPRVVSLKDHLNSIRNRLNVHQPNNFKQQLLPSPHPLSNHKESKELSSAMLDSWPQKPLQSAMVVAEMTAFPPFACPQVTTPSRGNHGTTASPSKGLSTILQDAILRKPNRVTQAKDEIFSPRNNILHSISVNQNVVQTLKSFQAAPSELSSLTFDDVTRSSPSIPLTASYVPKNSTVAPTASQQGVHDDAHPRATLNEAPDIFQDFWKRQEGTLAIVEAKLRCTIVEAEHNERLSTVSEWFHRSLTVRIFNDKNKKQYDHPEVIIVVDDDDDHVLNRHNAERNFSEPSTPPPLKQFYAGTTTDEPTSIGSSHKDLLERLRLRAQKQLSPHRFRDTSPPRSGIFDPLPSASAKIEFPKKKLLVVDPSSSSTSAVPSPAAYVQRVFHHRHDLLEVQHTPRKRPSAVTPISPTVNQQGSKVQQGEEQLVHTTTSTLSRAITSPLPLKGRRGHATTTTGSDKKATGRTTTPQQRGGGTPAAPGKDEVVEYIRVILQPWYNQGTLRPESFVAIVRHVCVEFFSKVSWSSEGQWKQFITKKIEEVM